MNASKKGLQSDTKTAHQKKNAFYSKFTLKLHFSIFEFLRGDRNNDRHLRANSNWEKKTKRAPQMLNKTSDEGRCCFQKRPFVNNTDKFYRSWNKDFKARKSPLIAYILNIDQIRHSWLKAYLILPKVNVRNMSFSTQKTTAKRATIDIENMKVVKSWFCL